MSTDRMKDAIERTLKSSRTIHNLKYPKRALLAGEKLYPEETRALRPKTRGECKNGIRPCPFVSCRHNLYLDVKEKTGSIQFHFDELSVDEMEHSCTLDLIEQKGKMSFRGIGQAMNLSRQAIEVIYAKTMHKINRTLPKVEDKDRSVFSRIRVTHEESERFELLVLEELKHNPNAFTGEIVKALKTKHRLICSNFHVRTVFKKNGYIYSRSLHRWKLKSKRHLPILACVDMSISNSQIAQCA